MSKKEKLVEPSNLREILKQDYTSKFFNERIENLHKVDLIISALKDIKNGNVPPIENTADKKIVNEILDLLNGLSISVDFKDLVDDTLLLLDVEFDLSISILNTLLEKIRTSNDEEIKRTLNQIDLKKLRLNPRYKHIATDSDLPELIKESVYELNRLLKRLFVILRSNNIDISEFSFITNTKQLLGYELLENNLKVTAALYKNLNILTEDNIEKIKIKVRKRLGELALERAGKLNFDNSENEQNSNTSNQGQRQDFSLNELENEIKVDLSTQSELNPEDDVLSSDVVRELEVLIGSSLPTVPYRLNSVTPDQETIKRNTLNELYTKFPILLFKSGNFINNQRSQNNAPTYTAMLEYIVERALFSENELQINVPINGGNIASNIHSIVPLTSYRPTLDIYKKQTGRETVNNTFWSKHYQAMYNIFSEIPEFQEMQKQIIDYIPRNAQIFLFIKSIVSGQSVAEMYKGKEWLKINPEGESVSGEDNSLDLLTLKSKIFYDVVSESVLNESDKKVLEKTIDHIYNKQYTIHLITYVKNDLVTIKHISSHVSQNLNISDGEWHSFYEKIKNIPQFREFQELIVPEVPMDAKVFLFIHSITEGKTLPELYENKKWMKQVSKATETELKERSKRQQYIDQKYNKFKLAVPNLNLTQTREYIVKACIESIYNGYKIMVSSGDFGHGIRGGSDLSKNVYNPVDGIDDTGFQSFAVALTKLPVFKDFENELESWVPSNAKVFLFIHKIVENNSLSEIYGEQSWLKTYQSSQESIESDDINDPFDQTIEAEVVQMETDDLEEQLDDYSDAEPSQLTPDIVKIIERGEQYEKKQRPTRPTADYSKIDFSVVARRGTDSNRSENKTNYSIKDISSCLAKQTIQSVFNQATEKHKPKFETMLSFYFTCALHHLFNTSEAVQDTNRLGEDRQFVVIDVAKETGLYENQVKAITENILTTLNRADLINPQQPRFSIDGLYGIIKRFVIKMNRDLSPSSKKDFLEYDPVSKTVRFDKEAFIDSQWVNLKSC